MIALTDYPAGSEIL